MTVDEVEAVAMVHPHAHKVRLWDRLDVYKLTTKGFCVCEAHQVSFKASPILYEILVRDGPGRPTTGFVPGAWVTLSLSDVDPSDLKDWVAASYGYAAAGLTKKKRAELGLA